MVHIHMISSYSGGRLSISLKWLVATKELKAEDIWCSSKNHTQCYSRFDLLLCSLPIGKLGCMGCLPSSGLLFSDFLMREREKMEKASFSFRCKKVWTLASC